MHAIMIALRMVHIVTGVFWAGAVIFINLLLLPSIGAAGPAGGRVMTELKQRRQHAVLFWTSSLAVLSGFALLWIDSGGFSHDWFRAPIGIALSFGGLAALTGFAVGLVGVRPMAIRLEEVQSEMARATTDALRQSYVPRLGELRGRLTVLGRLATGCVSIAVVAMAVARYL
jgi:hypothetical protein